MNTESKLYGAALAFALLSFVPLLRESHPLGVLVTQAASLLCLAGGVVVWARELALRSHGALEALAWGEALLWFLKWLLHAVVAIFVLVPAHSLVAEATGLPPTDFDLTVAACAILFFPLAWCLLVSAVAGAAAVLLLPGSIYSTVRAWFKSESPKRSEMLTSVRPMAALALAFIFAGSASEYERWAHSLVKPVLWFVYHAEYHELKNFPALKPGLRSHVHENGVVSYAKIVEGEVQIHVETMSRSP